MNKLREETATSDAVIKQKQADDGPKAAYGYGGKFGVQADRYFTNYSHLFRIIEVVGRNLRKFLFELF